VDGSSQRSGIKGNLSIPHELKRLPPALELVLFRTVQEGLTNVHRRSHSQSADIHLHLDHRYVTLAVRDYRNGISRELLEKLGARGQGSGIGLDGMRERVLQFNGWFEIQSDERGTLIRAVLPLSNGQP
jgi:signal transduction histidine kinase